MKTSEISIDPEVMGGTPVFKGTRVPIQTLLDYLEAGDSIDDFLEGFPTVKKSQVIAQFPPLGCKLAQTLLLSPRGRGMRACPVSPIKLRTGLIRGEGVRIK